MIKINDIPVGSVINKLNKSDASLTKHLKTIPVTENGLPQVELEGKISPLSVVLLVPIGLVFFLRPFLSSVPKILYWGFLAAAVLLGLIGASMIIAVLAKKRKQREEQILLPIIKSRHPNATVDENVPIFSINPVLPSFDRCYTLAHLNLGEVDVYDIKADDESTDSDGDASWFDVFRGQVVVKKLEKSINGEIQVVPSKTGVLWERSEYVQRRELNKIETDDIKFNETHEVYATDRVESMRLLNPKKLGGLFNDPSSFLSQVKIAVYIKNDVAMFSFYTGECLFSFATSFPTPVETMQIIKFIDTELVGYVEEFLK